MSPSLCHSGHLTEALATDAPPLALSQGLLSPSPLAPTPAPRADLDHVHDPDPMEGQGTLLHLLKTI